MARPGFIPAGDEFYATIRRPGLEEVIEDDSGERLKFPSAAAAVLHASRTIKISAAPPLASPDPDEELRRRWKVDRAEELRREREAFEMRNVEVVRRKRGRR